jgi:MFS family permease
LRFRLATLMFLQYAAPGAVLPVYSLHLKRLGLSPVQIGWACATQALAALVGPLLAGQVADRWLPAERCLVACAALSGAMLWLLGGLTTPAAVIAVTLAFWLVMGPAITLGTTLCFANLAAPERDFGPVRLWGTVGWVAASWALGGWLHFPAAALPDAFRLGSVLAFALAAYGLTLPHTPPRRRLGAWLAPLAALRQLRGRSFFVFALGSLGVSVTSAFYSQSVPLLLEHLGVPSPWITPTQTIAQSTEVLTLALLPMLLIRLEMRGTMLFGLGVWVAALVVLALGEPFWLVLVAFGGWGTVVCCYLVAGQVYVNGRTQGEARASAQALLTCVNATGMLLGNVAAGSIREASGGALGPVFAAAAAVVASVGVVVLVGFRAASDRA